MGKTFVKIVLFIFLYSAGLYAQFDESKARVQITNEVSDLRNIFIEAGFNPDQEKEILLFIEGFIKYRTNTLKIDNVLDRVIDAELVKYPVLTEGQDGVSTIQGVQKTALEQRKNYVNLALKEELGFDLDDLEKQRQTLERITYLYIFPKYKQNLSKRIEEFRRVILEDVSMRSRKEGKPAGERIPLPDRVTNIEKKIDKLRPFVEKRLKKTISQLEGFSQSVKLYVAPNQAEEGLRAGLLDFETGKVGDRGQISADGSLNENFTISPEGGLSDHQIPMSSFPKMYIKGEILQYTTLVQSYLRYKTRLAALKTERNNIQAFRNRPQQDFQADHAFLDGVEQDLESELRGYTKWNRAVGYARTTWAHTESSAYMLVALGLTDMFHFYTGGFLVPEQSKKEYRKYTGRSYWEKVKRDYNSGGLYSGFAAFSVTSEIYNRASTPRFMKSMSSAVDSYTNGAAGTWARGVVVHGFGLALSMKFMGLVADAVDFRQELFSTEFEKLHDLAVQYYLKKNLTTLGAWTQLASSTISFTLAGIVLDVAKKNIKDMNPPKFYKLKGLNKFMKNKMGSMCDSYHERIMQDLTNKQHHNLRMQNWGRNKRYYIFQRFGVTPAKAIFHGTLLFITNSAIETFIMFHPSDKYYEEFGLIMMKMEEEELKAFTEYLSVLGYPTEEGVKDADKKRLNYAYYVYNKFDDLYYLREITHYMKGNYWTTQCVLKQKSPEDIKTIVSMIYEAVKIPENFDINIDNVKNYCFKTKKTADKASESADTPENILTVRNFFTDAKADTNAQKSIGGIVTKDVSVDELVEGALITQKLGPYRTAYELLLKEGKWNDEAKQNVQTLFKKAKELFQQDDKDNIYGQLYNWMDSFAVNALYMPVGDMVYNMVTRYDDEKGEYYRISEIPDIKGFVLDTVNKRWVTQPTGLPWDEYMKVETEKNACGESVKRMEWFLYYILPKYFVTKEDKNNDDKKGFATAVARGLYEDMKTHCGYNENDKTEFYERALADVYPMMTLVASKRDDFMMLMFDIFDGLGLWGTEMEFFMATWIDRDGGRQEKPEDSNNRKVVNPSDSGKNR
ncbi:MAG: hypothetical protein V1647_03515 [Pseudomonadota bacterium]